MKVLYLDCGMGAAGDMLSAALLELLPDADAFIKELNSIGIPGVEYVREDASKCGIKGTHMSVRVNGAEEDEHELAHNHSQETSAEYEHAHTHSHNTLTGIEHIVRDHLSLPEKVREDVISVYKIIAEAESHVHGMAISDIHFHEVGSLDAIADVTAVCLLMDRLAPDKVIASPVHVGSGQVKCAHGILPVPAPATAYILKDIPMYGGDIKGELCTPTGAALLKYFVDEFGQMPIIKSEAIGYGMGKKDFERANCVRAILGNTDSQGDDIIELSCNIDDMTAEAIAFAMEELLAAGALDVFTQPIGMKKSRMGTLLTLLCKEEDRELMRQLLFYHTTTLGMREKAYRRYTLDRKIVSEKSKYGDIRKKISTGYGVKKEKYEYDDLSRICRENHISIEELLEELRRD